MDGAAQPSEPSRVPPARQPQRFWLAAKQERGRLEVLTAELSGDGRFLPVFSFAEEAALFLGLGPVGGSFAGGEADGDGWRAWETDAEELVSILLGPCRDVGRVALDPLPGIGVGPVNRLVSLGRERFVRFLLRGTPEAGSG